mmetsp:Transcript_13245/g.33436  ORF Transcript_13245/g.33436 Transcript_13245/m.33436 type:complete len:205 (-) Transcript_13245:21-635(-)
MRQAGCTLAGTGGGPVPPGDAILAYTFQASRGVPSYSTSPHHSSLNVMSGNGPPPGTTPPTSCLLGLPCPSFHHSSANSKMRPPMQTPPETELASTIWWVNTEVAFAWDASSTEPILALYASAPYSPRNMGLSDRPAQASNKFPKVSPLYLLMPQASTALNAETVAGAGISPWTVATGWVGSFSLMSLTASATLASARGKGKPA